VSQDTTSVREFLRLSDTPRTLGPDAIKPRYCLACASLIDPQALSCPACYQLIHEAEIEQIAAEARTFENSGNLPAAAALWGKALSLLPPDSSPAASIRDRRAALGAQSRIAFVNIQAEPAPPQNLMRPLEAITPGKSIMGPRANEQGQNAAMPLPLLTQKSDEEKKQDWKKRFGPIGIVLAFFAKFKTAALLLLTKGKFLLLGLTKLNTLLSMFASMGLYWALYGWKFGVGFVLGIYVHEMGHIWALRHFGLRASAPMFIPGFGAFVSLYDSPANPSQDARIGLAGPIWGTGAALAFLLPWVVNGGGIWLALAHAAAYINLFNLIPIWQLDGGRGFRALDRRQRLYSVALMLALWYFSNAGMFLFLALGGAYRVFWAKDQPIGGDRGAFLQYAGLLTLLGAMLAWIR
jgi:Zn-dependent protease